MEMLEFFKDLTRFLRNNYNERVEVETTEPKITFTAFPNGIAEDCGDDCDEFGWFFREVENEYYNSIGCTNLVVDLKDFARVRLVGETTWAWDISQTQQQEYLQAV